MKYDQWSSMVVGDRVKRVINHTKGTIISSVGIGYVVRWDNGKIERIQDGNLHKV